MSVVTVQRYASISQIGNGVPEADLDMFRPLAIQDWDRLVRRAGFQPMGQPTATLDRAHFPITQEVRRGPRGLPRWFHRRVQVELPNRQWRVVGRVLPDWVPVPESGWPDDDHLQIDTPEP